MPSSRSSEPPPVFRADFKEKVLLIVDKNDLVRRMIYNEFSCTFDQVFSAEDFIQAESMLENNVITHVICGQIFDENDLTGSDIIPQWRWLYPSIRRAVILSGTSIDEIQLSYGVDSIIPKPSRISAIIDALEDENEENPTEPSSDVSREILLIVDDNPFVLKSLSRSLKNEFGEVNTAGSSSEAELILKEKQVTHVICDHHSEQDRYWDPDLIRVWRQRYPSIRRVLLLAISDMLEIDIPSEVDFVFTKPVSPKKLLDELKS
ncbi:MAG: response regulator [Proteobacteria bacterium]|nr:response regulator [Pseudomonadota bacterium]